MPTAEPLLRGSALVTGAASGIGYATALAFAQHGIAQLALADINLDALNASIQTLRESCPHVEVLPLHLDVRKPDEVRAGVAQAVARFGRLDVAIDEDEWQRVIDINLNGVYRCQKEELAAMVGQEDLGHRRGRGVIVNVASMYGVVGPKSPLYQSAYATTKHGAEIPAMHSRPHKGGRQCLRPRQDPDQCHLPRLRRHAPHRDSHGRAAREPLHHHVAQTPMKRMATPEEVADSIVFLASPMSSFMHGAALVVDGGSPATNERLVVAVQGG
ncbi:hypothetical protein ACCO45_008521 [Purpureocillium lilacinum]|uniref:Uncharacterized protein n=1 Tax=Purpureocillium lilacinum TaxID=33203 RepID=A0ACC4DP94_PURLI